MTETTKFKASTTKHALRTIIAGGMLAGTLDALAAIIVFNVSPEKLFQFIASAAFGSDAFSGGLFTVLWGAFFHYFIAFSWTILFFFIYPVVYRYIKNRGVTVFLYGILIWLVMNRIVIPLTFLSQPPFDLNQALVGSAILIFAVSLPIVLFTHRYYRY